jgi:radical SAM protein with 4Fe4S-binding SPASM domain
MPYPFTLLRYLTLSRAWNVLKLIISYYFSRITGKPALWGKPLAVSIEPTTSCNLRCLECPSGLRSFSRPTGMLSAETFDLIFDRIGSQVFYLTFYFQGEPFLNPDFLAMVVKAKAKNLFVSTSSNAHYFDAEKAKSVVESGLDKLIISIDGTSQTTYEKYRIGGDLQKVLQGTQNIVGWKKKLQSKTPHLVFQFLVFNHNEHEIQNIYNLANDYEVNEVTLKTAQVYNYESGNNLIPANEEYTRYVKNREGEFTLKNKLLNHCWRMWHSCVITWDGKVVPCCFDKDATHQMGSLLSQSLNEIWQNEAYLTFRSTLLRSRSGIDICKNCSEGSKIWVTDN